MSKMDMSIFAFDENRKMIGRIDLTEPIDSAEFQPEWVSQWSMKEAFAEENPPVKPAFCFGLIKNLT